MMLGLVMLDAVKPTQLYSALGSALTLLRDTADLPLIFTSAKVAVIFKRSAPTYTLESALAVKVKPLANTSATVVPCVNTTLSDRSDTAPIERWLASTVSFSVSTVVVALAGTFNTRLSTHAGNDSTRVQ